jgi:hypothetical protein
MKKTGSLLLLQKFLDCFFLFNQKPFDLNKIELHFCLIQQSRELKQLINILLQIQKFQHNISSSKKFRVVFHVDNLLIKDLVTFLIFKCNLETKVTVDILNSSLSQKFFQSSLLIL